MEQPTTAEVKIKPLGRIKSNRRLGASIGRLMILLGVAWALLFYFSSSFLIDHLITQLQKQSLQHNIYTAQALLRAARDDLLHKSLDWGHWTDAYQFLQHRREGFVAENLGDTSLYNLDISGVGYARFDQHIVDANYVDNDGHNINAPALSKPDLEKRREDWMRIVQSSTISNQLRRNGQISSFTTIGGSLHSISGVLVKRTDNSGTSSGYILLCRQVSLADIGKILKSHIVYSPPIAGQSIKNITNKNSVYFVNIKGYDGRYLGSLQIITKNELSHTFFLLRNIMLIILLGLSVTLITVVFYSVDRIVTRRIENLYESISSQFKNQELSQLALTGPEDEITAFKRSYNALIQQVNNRISREIANNQALSQALVQAERATLAKTQFFASVSHELRTPLAGIIASIELITRRNVDALDDRLAKSLHTSAQFLKNIVNDVLDFSKFEKEGVTLDCSPFDIAELAQNVIRLHAASAESKNLAIHISLPANDVAMVIGDEWRLSQLLGNLISNAIKYTPAGSVDVAVMVLVDNTHSIRWRFKVCDTGIGIPAEIGDQLFEPFKQVDSHSAQQRLGTGLGLSICKKIASAMGGDIGFTSTQGRGSTFWFEVELPKAPPQQDAAINASEMVTQRSLRVLLAEDNDILRSLVEEMLEYLGHEVIAVENGRLAFEAASNGTFDIAIIDIQMPEMNGLEFSARLRAMRGTASTMPLIALTADIEAQLRPCFDLVLIKPVSIAELGAAINQLIPARISA